MNARQSQIITLLQKQERYSVDELRSHFRVSDMTIRRDLDALASRGQIIRTHGGALAAPKISFEFSFLRRRQVQESAKDRIADAAAKLVTDGQTVMLDSGTTTLAVAERLKVRRDLTVITSSLPIAAALQFCQSLRV